MQAVKDTLLGIMVKVMPVFNPTMFYAMMFLILVGIIGLVLSGVPTKKILIGASAVAAIALLLVFTGIVSNTTTITDSFALHLMWLGLVTAIIIFMGLVFTSQINSVSLNIGRVLIVTGLIFLACDLMGKWLGLSASINFANANDFGFNIWEFWKLGLMMFVPGIILAIVGRMTRDKREVLA